MIRVGRSIGAAAAIVIFQSREHDDDDLLFSLLFVFLFCSKILRFVVVVVHQLLFASE